MVDPGTFSALRFGIAALAFGPYLRRADWATWKGGTELGFWAGLGEQFSNYLWQTVSHFIPGHPQAELFGGMAAGYLAQAQGLLSTDASRASFISSFTVILVHTEKTAQNHCIPALLVLK